MKALDYIKAIPTGMIPTLIIIAGMMFWYGIARWDAMISANERQWIQETRASIERGHRVREFADSLRGQAARDSARADSFATIAANLRWARRMNARADSVARERAESTAVAVLASRLEMKPIAPDEFVADSNGVRRLYQLKLDADFARLELPQLREENSALREESRNLRDVARLTKLEADTLRAQNLDYEARLEEGLKVIGCKIVGFIPCPSRWVSAGLGAAAVVITLGVTK
jgi:hypothetical protein